MRFVKLQATGNDFILIQSDEERDWSSIAQKMCDRHFGAGADGLIILVPSMIADLGMKIFNQDGSEAEICGNGLRCLVRYAVDKGLVDKGVLSVETPEGLKTVRVQGQLLQVDMGKPKFKAADLPMDIEDVDIILDYPVASTQRDLTLTCLSMGNPHAVHFPEEPVAKFPLGDIGSEIENNTLFPKRVNFEIANVMSPQRIIARVWERGVGETLSCGTGACAVVVASRMHNWVEDEVDVILPGGMLTVDWDGVGEVKLRGPAEIVFHGDWIEPESAPDL